ncbi:hypothetical protein GUITHDRAFT_144941 [Guillardia theta CCMP2712]|uniref:Ubiquitin thioesterase OTU n=1 Tax=Guillardia theta (strain CCMP2712) TaxID=905079 RepID=L1IN35_GUITC|nr:hypothetical protein GUITHDRAFT_144941 [Guillardia theta CCMP2712]EKX37507.1 hypothetical protein GUITHDRAFT_144941 [Guillardia theta CCMP2712]|eukprot:XP_005824487.1 hypothetical protein GUITHDRAFT_144941 [Guillardia theta CCMP2712]
MIANAPEEAKMMVRRRMAKDNNCLFHSVGYLAEGRQGSICSELRAAVAEHVAHDPAIDEVLLGTNVQEYCQWIKNEMNWGGETEIYILAKKYNLEIIVGTCLRWNMSERLTGENRAGRIYILYTGQHYDALVGVKEEDDLPEAETRIFPAGEEKFDELAIKAGDFCYQEELKRKSVQLKKVEHDDDFMYECDEVEVECQSANEDEMTEKYHIFYNTDSDPLSNYFLCELNVDGQTYKSVEHYIQCVRYAPHVGLVNTIQNAKDAFEVLDIVAQTECGEVSGWDNMKQSVTMKGMRAKFMQNDQAREALLKSGKKDILLVGGGTWNGVQVEGEEIIGRNVVGRALKDLREEVEKR